jgi:hypothetical protein
MWGAFGAACGVPAPAFNVSQVQKHVRTVRGSAATHEATTPTQLPCLQMIKSTGAPGQGVLMYVIPSVLAILTTATIWAAMWASNSSPGTSMPMFRLNGRSEPVSLQEAIMLLVNTTQIVSADVKGVRTRLDEHAMVTTDEFKVCSNACALGCA